MSYHDHPVAPAPPATYPKRKRSGLKTALIVAAVLAAVAILLCLFGVALAGKMGGSTPQPSKTGAAAVAGLAPTKSAATQRTDEPSDDPAPTEEADDNQTFESGTYEVGSKSDPAAGTIKPGTFVLLTAGHCYWERVSGFGGSIDEVITNGNLEANGSKAGRGRITIKKSDAGLTLNGSCILGQTGGLK